MKLEQGLSRCAIHANRLIAVAPIGSFICNGGVFSMVFGIFHFRAFVFLIAFLLIPFVSFSASALDASAAPNDEATFVEQDYSSNLREAERLGQLIFEKDTAARVATDYFIDKHNLTSDRRIGGWITEEIDGGGYAVSFLGVSNSQTMAYYSIRVENGKVVKRSAEVFKQGVLASEKQASMYSARTMAAQAKFDLCSNRYNAVTIENADGSYFVYLLAATTDPNKMMIGGHYRAHINRNGHRVLDLKNFSKSCFSMPKEERALSVVFTHLLAPHPEEIHVFVSLLYGMPLYVLTMENDTTWSVNGARIKFVDKSAD